MKKIGFFGGSFDPIHLGHLNLALRILELKKLDQILFSLAHVSPMKQDAPPIAPVNHRWNMLELALEDIPNCEPYSGECRQCPSYTIDSIEEVEGNLYLILAEDTAYTLGEWKEVERLLEIAPPLVGVRHGFDTKKFTELSPSIQVKIKEGMCQIPAMDISSTEIRERLKKRLYCGHLVQGKVLDYIHQNIIYSCAYD